jgi:hypothetical protein
MSAINIGPDELSLSGNIKKFEIASTAEVIFILNLGATVILNEKYQPDASGIVVIDVKATIERILEINIPTDAIQVTEQINGTGVFTASVDGTLWEFKVIKGGVAELGTDASTWLNTHLLTWQPQIKKVLQSQPEWIGLYPITAGNLMITAYMSDGNSWTSTYYSPDPNKLYSINTSWTALASWDGGSGYIAWDVWYADTNGVALTPVMRYQLHKPGDEENIYVWANTIGGIDSISCTGYKEEDFKLVHQNALFDDDTILEYDVDKAREIRQSTGFLNEKEKRWIADFFCSRNKYALRPDGLLKKIAVVASKIITTDQNDQFDLEFTYRFTDDTQLLNLDLILDALPAPLSNDDFFLTSLLSGLPQATYASSLIMPVQSPYVEGWMQLSFAQLWAGAMPTLVDGISVQFVNGKLTASGVGGISTAMWQEIQNYIDAHTGGVVTDSSTKLISGTVVWKSGLTFVSTDLVYQIKGVKYTALAREITLNPADPDYSRIDLFYVDATSNLLIAAGNPALNPSKPELPETKLEVMMVLIEPGATTPQNIDVTIVYNENVEWETGSGADDYVSVDFESVNAPMTGDYCAEITIAVPSTVQETPVHYLGEYYQGGIIFWLDSTGTWGYVAAETDAVTYMTWANNQYGGSLTGANLSGIGDGYFNSNMMLMDDNTRDFAVRFCNQLNIGGWMGWWLPSQGELTEMYQRRTLIGNLQSNNYWSSTEVNESTAMVINFAYGNQFAAPKNTPYNVRAIHDFNDSGIPTGGTVSTVPLTNTTMGFFQSTMYDVDKGILSFMMRSSKPWLTNSLLTINCGYSEGVITGTVVMSPANLYGYNMYSTEWQMVAIQMFNFTPSYTALQFFIFQFSGAWPNDFNISFDSIRYQYGGATIPEDVLITAGVFGGPGKTLKVGVNAQGKITSITEYPITDGAGLVEDARFEFRDLAPDGQQSYVIDLSASYGYTITGAFLRVDDGTLLNLTLWINETAVTFSAVLSCDTWGMGPNQFTTIANNVVATGDEVVLVTQGSYTGNPTLLRGKLVTART